MATKTKTIKITDDRQGATFRTGINGKLFDLPTNQELNVDEALVEHLEGIGARFEEVEDAKRASSSKEGSVDELARPIGPHDVIAAGTKPKSLDNSASNGDQPGDVTAGGVQMDSGYSQGNSIKEDAEVSDTRVAAERRAPKDASVAELAGEGEQGTEKSDPQSVEPSHKDTSSKASGKKAKK